MGSNVSTQRGIQRKQQRLQQQAYGGHEALYIEELLENIFSRLSEGDLVRLCSLVCSKWHTAAVSVTVGRGVVSAIGSDELLLWLCRHGTGLRSLNVHGGSLCRDHGYSSIAVLQQLTRLELNNMTESPKLLSAIGNSMKDLVHLRLDNVKLNSDDSGIKWSVEASSLWAGCSRLTYLQAKGCGYDKVLAGTFWGSLPHLKTLDLEGNPSQLDVSTVLSNSASSTCRSVRDGCLLQLEALNIKGISLTRPYVLGALTMLTSLNMADVAVFNPGNLLVVLPQLLQLQHLDMRRWQAKQFNFTVTVAGLRDALLPLTQLTALALSNTSYEYDPATVELEADGQPGSASGLFAGLYLPQLQVLDAEALQWSDKLQRTRTPGPLCGPGGLQALAAAAPAVRCLRIKGSLLWWGSCGHFVDVRSYIYDVRSLSTLAHLTSLEMSAGLHLHDWDMQCLSKLPTLSSLTIAEVGRFITDQGILGLSALSALSHLKLTEVLSSNVSLKILPLGKSEFKLQNKLSQSGRLESTVAQQLEELSVRRPSMKQEVLNKVLRGHQASAEADKAQDKVQPAG